MSGAGRQREAEQQGGRSQQAEAQRDEPAVPVEKRPRIGLTVASTAAATRNTAPIAAALAPKW